ncbi:MULTISPECIES: prepilin-type N-terminal cleavage/methylation domain-containing protein [unclassified Gemella]|uniref:prepilin-type N-terminal cleavage/methylation domain-containing protein n=1 Tax=unclassified Gemella TaxID=2624949 RepID=UPI001C54F8EF|nr:MULTISPECIES: prepilin-type N-terminal cleavage/methylation domain-containing protein [unclassified Gemella]
MNTNNKGFTFIEVIISVLLLSILILLLSYIINLSSNISKRFLNYSDYEYAMMHKKIFEIYDNSSKMEIIGKNIYFINEKDDTEDKIVFTSRKIYKQRKNPDKYSARGYSLLLENIKDFSFDISDEVLTVNIRDRENKLRKLKLKIKNEQSDENKESEKGEEED